MNGEAQPPRNDDCDPRELLEEGLAKPGAARDSRSGEEEEALAADLATGWSISWRRLLTHAGFGFAGSFTGAALFAVAWGAAFAVVLVCQCLAYGGSASWNAGLENASETIRLTAPIGAVVLMGGMTAVSQCLAWMWLRAGERVTRALGGAV